MADNGKLSAAQLAPIAQGQLRRDCAAAWNAMNVQARKRGCELLPNGSKSSYRTYAQQVELWQLYKSGRGALAAQPGTSNHGAGIAVDVATRAMRATIDSIGERYGWAKWSSDAPGEWWHLKWREGSYTGADPGPYGQSVEHAPQSPEPIQEADVIQAVVKQNGVIEVFVEKAATGEVFHTWQTAANSGWAGAEKGKRSAAWYSLGTPGK